MRSPFPSGYAVHGAPAADPRVSIVKLPAPIAPWRNFGCQHFRVCESALEDNKLVFA
jgi:hypothetical protein